MNVLDELNKKEEWNEIYGNSQPELNKSHAILVNYSIGALFFTKVLTPFEYDTMEPIQDESDKIMFMKLMPKEKKGDIQDTYRQEAEE